MSKAEQIYEKVRRLPEIAQAAVLYMVEGLNVETSSQMAPSEDATGLVQRFRELAETWRRETALFSFVQQRAMHPAYQRIIGMGWLAVPLILQQLRRQPDHWLWALHSITGEEPAHATDGFQAAVEAWLRWGFERGLLPNGQQ